MTKNSSKTMRLSELILAHKINQLLQLRITLRMLTKLSMVNQMIIIKVGMRQLRNLLIKQNLTIQTKDKLKDQQLLIKIRMLPRFHTWIDLRLILVNRALYQIKPPSRTSLTMLPTLSMEKHRISQDRERMTRSTIQHQMLMLVEYQSQVRVQLPTMESSMLDQIWYLLEVNLARISGHHHLISQMVMQTQMPNRQ